MKWSTEWNHNCMKESMEELSNAALEDELEHPAKIKGLFVKHCMRRKVRGPRDRYARPTYKFHLLSPVILESNVRAVRSRRSVNLKNKEKHLMGSARRLNLHSQCSFMKK